MGAQHTRGHLATVEGPLVLRVVGVAAILGSVAAALAFVALSVSAGAAGAAVHAPGARPVAATATPSSTDGPVTEPRGEGTAEPAASPTGTATAGPRSLPRTGAPSTALLGGSLFALAVGATCLVVGRALPVGRHERA